MKNMKKLICMMLALAMVLALCACGSTASTTATEATEAPAAEEAADEAVDYSAMSLDELKAIISTVTEGKLTMATSPDFAPFEFYAIDDSGAPVLAGADVALAQYIADYLGLELEVIAVDFDGVLNELASGNVDIAVAGLAPDPKRMDAMDFSDIYYVDSQSFVTVQALADQFTTLDDTNKAELSIGVQNGSIQADLAEQYSPDADIVVLGKVTDIIAELLGGKLDGAYIATAIANNYAVNYPDLTIVLDVPEDVEGSAVGVCKGNEALLAGVNMAIAAAKAEGAIDRFVAEANELATGNIYEGLIED
jgi:polar amino acid transport system substrate-binding protein